MNIDLCDELLKPGTYVRWDFFFAKFKSPDVQKLEGVAIEKSLSGKRWCFWFPELDVQDADGKWHLGYRWLSGRELEFSSEISFFKRHKKNLTTLGMERFSPDVAATIVEACSVKT